MDVSPEMIKAATRAAKDFDLKVTFITSAVEDLSFEPDTFDTIVSTLSLCAYADPVAVLNQFNRWCRKDGLVLMLEHGAGSYTPIRWVQNLMDGYQFRRIGCHANRDMLKIINSSQLSLIRAERRLLGIMYLIKASKGAHSLSPEKFNRVT